MTYQVANDEIRKSILILLRPLVLVNFVLGTCPCIISPEGHIKTPLKYFNFARFFIIVGLLIFLSLSPLLRGCISMLQPSPDDDYLNRNYFAVSGKKEVVGMTLTRYVDMACGFYANLVPAVFLCLASCKRKQILNFFDSMSSYVNGISAFGDYNHVKRVTTRLLVMHGVFGLVISVMLALRYVDNSSHGPGTMVLWFLYKDNSFSSAGWLRWCIAPFFGFLSVAKTAVTAFIEVVCVSLASCFCRVIENIQEYLNDVMRQWGRRFLDDQLSTYPSSNEKQIRGDMEANSNMSGCNKDSGISRKIINDFENYLEKIRSNNSVTTYNSASSAIPGRNYGDFGEFRELTPGQQIIFVIEKFQAVRNMQTVVNDLFGLVLALNISLTVFMSVVLKYMLIWNFGNLMQKNGNVTSQQNNGSIPDYMENWLTRSSSEWSLFALLDTCFSVRLIILVSMLGNVHYASIKFNSHLSQALLQAQRIGDSIEVQGQSNKFFRGRAAMTQCEANTVLAFITENSANPLSFSASGLFCFNRNLILVIISIITTYLVFLLQV